MPSAPQPLPPAAADFPSLLLPVIGAIVMVLLALAIICLRCRAEEVRREGLPRLDAEEEVAKMRQRELVDAIMREKGLAAAPSAAVPNLQLQSQAARRSMSMPKPLPLPSFRRWTSQASARTAPEMKPQQQLEAWLQQERRSEREIGALRRELEALGRACEAELRQLEERELVEMDASVARIVGQERELGAEQVRVCLDDCEHAAHAREEWAAAAPEREEQKEAADDAILELLGRMKELRKLRKELIAPRGRGAQGGVASSPPKRATSTSPLTKSGGAASTAVPNTNLTTIAAASTAAAATNTTKRVAAAQRQRKSKVPGGGKMDPNKATKRAAALKSAVSM
jgi:hypothetical protein